MKRKNEIHITFLLGALALLLIAPASASLPYADADHPQPAVMANVSMPIAAAETTLEPKSRLGSMNGISLEQTILVSNNVAPIDLFSISVVVN